MNGDSIKSETINKSWQFVSDRRSAAINFSGGYNQIADLTYNYRLFIFLPAVVLTQ